MRSKPPQPRLLNIGDSGEPKKIMNNLAKIETFTKATDVDLWLSRLRRVSRLVGIERDENTIGLLAANLDDECYRMIESVGFSDNWDEMENKMRTLFGRPNGNPLIYLHRFTNRVQRPDENVVQFAAALREMIARGLHPVFPERNREENREGLDNLLREQFILGLRDRGVAEQLRFARARNWEDLIHIARENEMRHEAYEREITNFTTTTLRASDTAAFGVGKTEKRETIYSWPTQLDMPSKSPQKQFVGYSQWEPSVSRMYGREECWERPRTQGDSWNQRARNGYVKQERSFEGYSPEKWMGPKQNDRTPPRNNTPRGAERDNRGCFNCGMTGHIARNCKAPKVSQVRDENRGGECIQK